MQVRRQPDGTYIPDPDWHPTDLVTVRDVYGRRHRVRRAHLEEGRVMLPRFNQYGRRLVDNSISSFLNRENIAGEDNR